MGFIGLSPNNFLSPIDFVPGIGPLNRLRKAVKYANQARKSRKASGLIGKGKMYVNTGMASVHGILGSAGMYVDYRFTKEAVGTGMDIATGIYEFIDENEDVYITRGKLPIILT